MPSYRTAALVPWWLGSLAAASCGANDRVPVLAPAVPPIVWIDVIPATATMTPGDTLRFHVVASPTVRPAVWTWSSSDTMEVRVDGAGLARAMARSTGVAVCATAVVDSGMKACATIVIPAVL